MFAAGAGLFVIGYALIWTGVQRFRGKDYSLLSSLGVSGGGKVTPVATPTSSDNQSNVQREQNQANVIPASVGNPTSGQADTISL